MDYEKKYNEALERARALWREAIEKEYVIDYLKDYETIFPELAESEDERIRRTLVEYFGPQAQLDFVRGIPIQKIRDWLENQKEPEKEELVYRLNGLMQEYINEAKDQEEEEHRFKCYKLFWDALEDTSYFEQKEQKPVEKQDYSGLNDLERAILRGFLCAGVENVPVGIIKDTAAECIGFLALIEPTWSEKEIEEMVNERAIKSGTTKSERAFYRNGIKDAIKRFDLRPPFKPSEEQMNALQNAVALTACDKELARLYNQLKKL